MRAKNNLHTPSIPLLICSLLFILTGIITIATASPAFALNEGFSSNHYLIHQLLFGFLPGIFLGVLAFLIPLDFIKKYALGFFLISYLLMFSVFVPGIGICEGGACRWANILGFNFQPVEFLKLTTIIYLGALFSSEKIKNPVINFAIIIGLIVLALFLQSNLSTLITIFLIAVAILFSSNTKMKDVLIIGVCGIILFCGMVFTSPYRMERVMTFLDPLSDTLGDAYQINQSLISIGSGGINGSGLGLSAQKFGFVPESMSDSIFAIYAEELGFLGCAFLVLLLVSFAFYSIKTAKKTTPFGKLLAVGICTWIVSQSFINISAMSGLMPLSGTPLPFISYGGTHLVIELAALGLLLNISRSVNNEKNNI
ncbi:MAG: FtsW/RodA/SpoVE family cell cycle protein [Candidatus Pacebacteria bacterium]|nr:FtsW/RodA/SpoVE family cell cycle protein [Candidatus Paceibacterota bacterium]